MPRSVVTSPKNTVYLSINHSESHHSMNLAFFINPEIAKKCNIGKRLSFGNEVFCNRVFVYITHSVNVYFQSFKLSSCLTVVYYTFVVGQNNKGSLRIGSSHAERRPTFVVFAFSQSAFQLLGKIVGWSWRTRCSGVI